MKKNRNLCKVIYHWLKIIIHSLLMPLTWMKNVVVPPERQMMLLVGLGGVGKTTLLYRLRIPNWNPAKSKDEKERKRPRLVDEDPSYHYEEFEWKDAGLFYGIWDLPGDVVWQRMWPVFYRSMRVAAVIFMVDGAREDDATQAAQAKALFRQLIAEDELRNAAFCVLVNNKNGAYSKEDDFWKHELELDHLHKSTEHRVRAFCIDVAEIKGPQDEKWEKVLHFINNHSPHIMSARGGS